MDCNKGMVTLMKDELRQLLQNQIISKILSDCKFRCSTSQETAFIFNDKVAFKVYVHCGTLYFDVYDLAGARWGWDIGSVIQEFVPRSTIDAYLAKARSMNVRIEGFENDQIVEFLTSLLILQGELTDVIAGRFSKYSKLFQPMTADQRRELENAIPTINVASHHWTRLGNKH